MTTALHRIQFSWPSGIGLDLEWTKGRGAAATLPYAPDYVAFVEAELEPDMATRRGIPPICHREDCPVLFESFQLRENTDYYIDITLPIQKSLAETTSEGRPGWPFHSRLGKVFQIDPPRRWRDSGPERTIVSGVLRLRNHAGILDLRTEFGDGIRMEVVCQKIGYLDEFRVLLDQVADELAELLLQYDSPVSAGFNASDLTSENEAGLLFHLRQVMSPDNLPSSMDDILGAFHSQLLSKREKENLYQVQEADIETLASELDVTNLRPGGPLSRFFNGYTPQSMPVIEQFETIDTPENRYVKYFLQEIQLISARLRDQLLKSDRPASASEAAEWVEQIEELLSARVWRDVGRFRQFPSNSQVLQKGRGYRDVLKYDLALRMGLELPWKRAGELAEGIDGDLRPVSELYEYWCFFMIRRTLADICEKEIARRSTLVSTSHNGLRVSLRKGQRSKTSFIYRENDGESVEVNLFYNRRFKRPKRPIASWSGSYTASFDPDYSIEVVLQREAGVFRHWLHFDAKYRINEFEVEALFEEELSSSGSIESLQESEYETELRRVHKQEDLFKMHTYRDGILSTRGAYIVYPGSEDGLHYHGQRQNLFVRNPATFGVDPKNQIPSVGAFSLSPRSADGQRSTMAGFLKSVFEGLIESTVYAEETGLF